MWCTLLVFVWFCSFDTVGLLVLGLLRLRLVLCVCFVLTVLGLACVVNLWV